MTISNSLAVDDLIVTGKWYSLESNVMEEVRPYAVYLPPSYERGNRRYPVMYILDGDATRLKGMSGLVESLSSENLEKQIPEFIIVAIPNTNRVRDLTPTHSQIIYGDSASDELENSGGANRFLDFFKSELIPFMDKSYRTNQVRVLVGESYGGLFAAHTLLTSSETFTHYLITDATYIWDNNYLNRLLSSVSSRDSSLQGKVYFSFANNVGFGEMGEANLKWGQAFAKRLADIAPPSLKVKDQYFTSESHGTVAFLSWYHGLKFLFSQN